MRCGLLWVAAALAVVPGCGGFSGYAIGLPDAARPLADDWTAPVGGGGAAQDASRAWEEFEGVDPDRWDPFRPAVALGGTVEAVAAESLPRYEVRLVGFVHFGQPRALLTAANGELVVAAVGDRVSDVYIEAIQPPRVTLRGGATTRQLSLFDAAAPSLRSDAAQGDAPVDDPRGAREPGST